MCGSKAIRIEEESNFLREEFYQSKNLLVKNIVSTGYYSVLKQCSGLAVLKYYGGVKDFATRKEEFEEGKRKMKRRHALIDQ